MINEKRKEAIECRKSSTRPSSPASPIHHQIPVMSPLIRNKVSTESTPFSSIQISSGEGSLKSNYMHPSNLGLPTLNNNNDNSNGNPSAAAALLMMNAILASQHQQQQVKKEISLKS